jgi:hypothetical protein
MVIRSYATETDAVHQCNRDGCGTSVQPRRMRYISATETDAVHHVSYLHQTSHLINAQ